MAKDRGKTRTKKPAGMKDLRPRTLTAERAKAVKGGQAVRAQVRSILTQSPGYQSLPADQQTKLAHDM
ncbi:MAG TPA: hypothetical protein VLT62_00720 [Candidatus Methylomirabilis sp.]|nr:hypothetical protein [Candidatus Methylomirabilis sp.]